MAIVERMPYLPFTERGSVVDGAFRWRLGVRPLDLDDWIQFGDDADEWIAQKREVCAAHHDTVFAALDGVEAESIEVAHAVVDHLARRWPDRPRKLDPALHPLDAVARLVAEDLVLMVEREGRLVVGAGSVCFPNRWDLRSKLGRTMAEVHEPVPELNRQLESAIDRFLHRLAPGPGYWRLGWGLIDVADGYTPIDGTASPRPSSIDASGLFLRVERETLRRFGDSRCVLFTIRSYIRPVMDVVTSTAEREALARSVAAMGETIREYKDLSTLGEQLLAKLI